MDSTAVETRTRLSKGQRTASRILDAAEELFASAGYGATSLRDIADQVGIQQPGLYKHFSGKEDLYRRVYERALKPLFMLMDRIIDGPDDMPGLYELAGQMTDLLALHPNIARLLIRAAISRESDVDEIAGDWLAELIAYGHRISAKAGIVSNNDILAVEIVAIFNMLFGYFWSAPLVETLTGKAAGSLPLLEIQKALLQGFVRSLSSSMPNQTKSGHDLTPRPPTAR
ncbi:helix-turn-helix domain-containing protein [Silvimonas sp.]|uniref:TetR/AcrR family transcriptional regulator n=1 Tax=Silvimonas sp. TaxID=2650811 RepID=UPI002842333C|nr:helix-turn-helix domain-containing protein [Silvimonas sp.]MDR3426049.1 helix-turn-helix domain containing protein [Silvimonas sp.]